MGHFARLRQYQFHAILIVKKTTNSKENCMESFFEKRLTVTPDYCDASGALSPLAAFTIFQGIAAQHAEVLGVGSSAMAKKGEFWLTVHTRVDLFERAYLMDELTVRTWAEACSERDVRTYRSYTLSRGEAVIARGKTEWAILGPEQKIIRFGDSGFPKDYPFPAETAIPEKLQRSMKSLRTPAFSRTTPCGRRTSTSATT
ncbi:acyl-CoA thioesterase [Ruminococcaceae bacterium AF10-16]|nr:acyl-CoA thioesterase [Ruminococcaceae bacterium AF10-16]